MPGAGPRHVSRHAGTSDELLSKERVNGIPFTLNGDLMSDRVFSSYSLDITDSGTHNIAIALQTSYGRSATHGCHPYRRPTAWPSPPCASGVLRDPDGPRLSYHWWVTYTDTGETRDLGLRSAAFVLENGLARGISRLLWSTSTTKAKRHFLLSGTTERRLEGPREGPRLAAASILIVGQAHRGTVDLYSHPRWRIHCPGSITISRG